MAGRLLALDLWGTIGAARFEPPPAWDGTGAPPVNAPVFSTFEPAGPDLAAKQADFWRFLNEEYRVWPFDALAWERPLLVPKRDVVATLEIVMGQTGLCYAFAGGHNLRWIECPVEQAKITLTGKKSSDKDAMIKAARVDWGWKVANHHEADAGGVGVWSYDQLWPLTAACTI